MSAVNELSRVGRLVRIEPFSVNLLVNFELFLTVFRIGRHPCLSFLGSAFGFFGVSKTGSCHIHLLSSLFIRGFRIEQ